MKDVSPEYIAKEEATERNPDELYHIWRGAGDILNTNVWYYTSGDVDTEFDGHTYLKATLKRSLVKWDANLEISKMTVQAAYVQNPVLEYVAVNPVEGVWISVVKIHRDMSPLEADLIFIGQIKRVSFKGVEASVECVGFEFFLKMPIPTWRYQLNCNHKLFDSKCLLVKNDYKVTCTVVLDATKTELTSAVFGTYDDTYFTGGTVEFGGEAPRTIVAHSGITIVIAYKFRDLDSGESVDVYPGCDGRAITCRDKFLVSNIVHFLGFPFIPEDNPSLRS